MADSNGDGASPTAGGSGGGVSAAAAGPPWTAEQTSSEPHSHREPSRYLKSCGPCRARKTKCDRVAPCSSCLMRSTEHLCYTDVSQDLRHLSGTPAPAKRQRTVHDESQAQHSPTSTLHGQPTLRPLSSSNSSSHFAPLHPRPTLAPEGGDAASAVAPYPPYLLPRTHVTWREHLEPLLLDARDCHKLFHCFFSELDSYIACIHPLHVEEAWKRLHDEGHGASRSAASLILAIAALTLLLAPRAHSAHRAQAAKHHRRLFETAVANLQHEEEDEASSMLVTVVVFERLQALDLCCHYANMSDASSKAWYLISYSARLGKCMDLFDEHAWPSQASALERELRRRVAWDLISLDRWQAIVRRRRADLDMELGVAKPRLDAWRCYDLASGRLLGPEDEAALAADSQDVFEFASSATCGSSNAFLRARNDLADLMLGVHTYLRQLSRTDPSSRRAKAEELEAALQHHQLRLSPELGQETARSPSASPDSLRQAALSLTTWSGIWYVRCVLTRVFLTDAQAPRSLRYASLVYAWNIIELMHSIVSLSASPWISFPTGWTTEHIFAAATTVVSLFSVDQQPGISANDLSRFASVLAHVKSVLEILASNDFAAAGICKDILAQCCSAEKPLQERLKAYASQDQTREYQNVVHYLRPQHYSAPDCVVATRASTPPPVDVRIMDEMQTAVPSPRTDNTGNHGSLFSSAAENAVSGHDGIIPDEPLDQAGIDSLLGIFNLAESEWRTILQ